MKPISKRLFSLLLAVIVVLGLPFTAMAATEPDSSQASGDLPLEWQIISDNLPDPIPGYDPHDPDNPYPYGVPVDTFYPIEEIDPYAVAPAALDQSYIPEEMRDNAILRALEYTGYDVQYLKKNGYLYVRQYIGSSLKTNAPQVLSDIGYWSTGACPNGDETVADSSTVTGRAPKLSYFESNGLVCASFVTYYLCNYLPNIEGVDTSPIYEKAKEMGADTNNSNLYYLTTVTTWKRTLDGLASENGSGVTKYTDETKAYKNLVPGDVIVFASEGTLKHIAIYASNGHPDIGADRLYSDAQEKGPMSTMPEIPGLILHAEGHVGIYIGGGYAIEAMGTRYGVVKARVDNRSWTGWCKSPYITYIEEAEIPEEPSGGL